MTGLASSELPPWLTAINRSGRTLARLGYAAKPLEVEGLLAEASRRTGIEELDEAEIREPLAYLLDALEHEAELSAVGRALTRARLMTQLERRARILRDHRGMPELGAEEIVEPLFIVGLPRTGTTALFHLLAQDPALLSPLQWKLEHPSPPPEHRVGPDDPRVRATARKVAVFHRMLPSFRAIHRNDAQLPEECTVIKAGSFRAVLFVVGFAVPSYRDYLLDADQRPAYAYHRRFLQSLQYRVERPRWLLKTPGHLFALDELFAAYPDAKVVLTHRDPLEVTASLASLAATLRGLSSEAVDRAALGPEIDEFWSEGLRRCAAFRARRPELSDRFFDLEMRELVAEPLAAVRSIYAWLGRELGARAQLEMQEFWAAHPRDQHGEHRYALEDFGLTRAEVARRYADYRAARGYERGRARGPRLVGSARAGEGERVCVVTGATAGIGLETALALARTGATVAIVGRDRARGEAAVERLQHAGARAARLFVADLSIRAQVLALAEALLEWRERVDLLINNAGAVFGRRRLSDDGLEMHLAVNYVSAFVLTGALLGHMPAGARVVNLSSQIHARGRIRFEDPQIARAGEYKLAEGYAQSKLAMVLFTSELARRARSTGVTFLAFDPGFVKTEIGDKNTLLDQRLSFRAIVGLLGCSAELAGRDLAHVASERRLASYSGAYLVRRRMARPAPAGQDRDAARRLWDLSHELSAGVVAQPLRFAPEPRPCARVEVSGSARTVVVTGAEGFVGNNLCRRLAGGPDRVVAMVYDEDARSLDGVDVELVRGDVFDRPGLERVFAGADVVVNLAARVSTTDTLAQLRVNHVGPRHVALACRGAGVGRLIHLSTSQVYRTTSPEARLDEGCARVDDRAPAYDRSKLLGEEELLRTVDGELDALILNPTGILGPHDYGPSIMGKRLGERYGLSFPGIAGAGFDWVDVRDVAAAIEAAMTRGRAGHNYLLSGSWISSEEFARIIQRAWEFDGPVRALPASVVTRLVPALELVSRARGQRPPVTAAGLETFLSGSRWISHAKASAELGYRPRAFEETVADTLAWMREAR